MTGQGAKPVDTGQSPSAVWRTLGIHDVTIEGGLWAKRQQINRSVALSHGYRMLEAAGNLENVRIAAGRAQGAYRGPVFMDSDVYKWLEAAAYEFARLPDDSLRATMNNAIDLVEAAQEEGGYLNSYYQVAEPDRRWTDFAHGHELYCAGHLFQAAIAHRRATGEGRLLRIAQRFADNLDRVFGPGKRSATPGHPEIEMALIELFRETRDQRYRDLAHFFVGTRGHGWLGPGRYNSSAYYQDRVPVRDAHEIEGHAVRALYLATGVADLYLETGEEALLRTLERQWADLVERKVYVTGGVGSRHFGEAAGQPYELPNDAAYCETCAAIGSVMWSWRMLLATGQSRFADLMERTLYNAVLSGVSLDGQRYFYVNPLASNGMPEYLSRGGCQRQEWHRVACCPPNVMRLLASFGHYIATRDARGLQIHQYAPARIACELGVGQQVAVHMDGAYPWDEAVRVTVDEAPDTAWTLRLRIPSWCEEARIRVNGETVSGKTGAEEQGSRRAGGYFSVERKWVSGDVIEANFPMTAQLIEAHPGIEATRGCVAIERGPLVYCIEQADFPHARLEELELDGSAALEPCWQPDVLDGVTVLRTTGFEVDQSAWSRRLYRPLRPGESQQRKQVGVTAIPYYAWANRGPGPMRVWIPYKSGR